ncbi:hypothetical protein FACS1894184_21230 [Clostridia bacterium]|nr:hypothetical protein FACS1894184_21230 [Clostridia bacterium]
MPNIMQETINRATLHHEMWQDGDMTYYTATNARALADFNTAINALYALDCGANSANTKNTSTYLDAAIKKIGFDPCDWAAKCSMVRSLLFGDDLNWDYAQRCLAAIPDSSTKEDNPDD